MASTSKPTFMTFTETWLDDSISDKELNIDSYKLFRRDRSRHGGGVCVYVSESFQISSVVRSELLELIWVRVPRACGRTLLLGVFCRKPSSDGNLDQLEKELFSINSASDDTILVGDFNINLLDCSSSLSSCLKSLMLGFGLTQVVSEPTRVTSSGSSMLDHVYVSDATRLQERNCQVLPPLGTSDHCCIHLILSLHLARGLSDKPRKVWLYRRADFDVINARLEEAIGECQQCITDCVDSAWD